MAALALESDVDLGELAAEAVPSTPKQAVKKKKSRKSSAKKDKKEEPESTTKKCADCGQTKSLDDFNDDQGVCRGCYNTDRSLLRVAKTQGVKAQVGELKKQDPKNYESLRKAFVKSRSEQKKKGSRVKFGIANFISGLKRSDGCRIGSYGEMMWEEEYYEVYVNLHWCLALARPVCLKLGTCISCSLHVFPYMHFARFTCARFLHGGFLHASP